jgi:tRNA A37 threonylcarbamoyladenosine dehydratase
MRKELKQRGITDLKVVYSKETPYKVKKNDMTEKQPPASISFVPSVAGMILAGEVVKDICNL